MWASRGWVTPDGQRRRLTITGTANGQRLYRLGDVLDAERDTRNSIHSPRHPARRAA